LEYFFGFVILLGVLIFVHEFGHFAVAKLAGIKVLKFSLGFPPSLITRKWGETEYTLSWVPLGGYVKLLGEDKDTEEEIPPEDIPRAYSSKPIWVRFAVIAAGPVSNYLLALILLCAGYMIGWPVLASEIGKVLEDTPARAAGLREGDLVTAIDGVPVQRWDDMRSNIEKHPNQALTFTVERSGRELDLKITPVVGDQKDVFGRPTGKIGVVPSGKRLQLDATRSVWEGVRFTFQLTGLVIETLVKLVKLEISPKALSGPITIAQASGESLKAGAFSFIFLLSFISINLAVINLLPVPILDGGHLLFLLVEAVMRRPLTGRVREVATHAGLLFIILLMGLVFYNDISRIIEQGWTLKP
jgi:regulator of sigma E protease